MDLGETIRGMLNLIVKKREAFMSGSRTLEVSLSALNILNKILKQDLTHPLGPEFAKLKLPSLEDLTMAKITLEKVPSLVILGGPRIEKMQPVDLSLFPKLERLRISSVKPYLIDALPALSLRLSYVKVTNALASGDELLEFEDHPDGAWNELKTLDLSDNFMVDIHPLTGTLHNITDLDLSNNMITQIKCIQGCYALQRLCLAGNQIEDLKGVSTELGCIRVLNLRKNKIHSLDGLEGLFGLEELDLGENKIDNFSEVSKLGILPLLSSLCLDGNDVTMRKTYRQDVLGVFIKQFTAETIASAFCLDGVTPTEEELLFIESSTPKIYNPRITFSSRAVSHGMDANSTVSEGAVTTPVAVVKKKRTKQKRKKKTKVVKIYESADQDCTEDDAAEESDNKGESMSNSVGKKAEAWMEKINDIKEKFGKKWLVGVNELMNEMDPHNNENIDEVDGLSGSKDEEASENCGDLGQQDEQNIEKTYLGDDISGDYEDNDGSDSQFAEDFDASKDFIENKGSITDYSYLLNGADNENDDYDNNNDDDDEYSNENDEDEDNYEKSSEGLTTSAASDYASSSAIVTDYSSLFIGASENADDSSKDPTLIDDENANENDQEGGENENRDKDETPKEEEKEDIKESEEQPRPHNDQEIQITVLKHAHPEDTLTRIQKEIDEHHENPIIDAFNLAIREDADVATWLTLKVFSDEAGEMSVFALNCVSYRKKVPTLLILSNKAVYIISSETPKPVSCLKEWIVRKSTIVPCPIQQISRIIVGPWYQYICIEEESSKSHCLLTNSHAKAHCFVDNFVKMVKWNSIDPVVIHTAKETRLNFTDNIIRSKVNKMPSPATFLLYAQVFCPEKKKYRTLILTPMRLVMCKEDIGKWPLPKSQFTKEKETFLLELVNLTASSNPPWTLKFSEERESWSVVFGEREDMLIALKAINYAFFQKTKTFITS